MSRKALPGPRRALTAPAPLPEEAVAVAPPAEVVQAQREEQQEFVENMIVALYDWGQKVRGVREKYGLSEEAANALLVDAHSRFRDERAEQGAVRRRAIVRQLERGAAVALAKAMEPDVAEQRDDKGKVTRPAKVNLQRRAMMERHVEYLRFLAEITGMLDKDQPTVNVQNLTVLARGAMSGMTEEQVAAWIEAGRTRGVLPPAGVDEEGDG